MGTQNEITVQKPVLNIRMKVQFDKGSTAPSCLSSDPSCPGITQESQIMVLQPGDSGITDGHDLISSGKTVENETAGLGS